MPEQFLNPSPSMSCQTTLFFDFPCEGSEEVNALSSYRAANCPPNYNLAATGVESLYGQLGSPPCEQGHPFMREYGAQQPGGETEDPTQVDQIVDADRGMEVNHTGRLSGTMVSLIASKPNFSIVKITAVAVSLVDPTKNVVIEQGIPTWLEPSAVNPNVWFYHNNNPSTNELLYSAHKQIISRLDQTGFVAETVYKLVYHWEFWRDTGNTPYPNSPDPVNRPKERLPISGFDESIAFQVVTGTGTIP